MDIEVKRSNRQTMALEVTPQAKVIVRAPFWTPDSEIERLIKEKSLWIEKNVQVMRDKKKKLDSVEKMTKTELRTLARHARSVIVPKTEYFAKIIGVTYGRIAIRSQKSRWGSCSAKGNLNFNCLLLFAPEEVMDYVIVHELCHRRQMNHSNKFWNEVAKVLPQYKQQRQWLKTNGSLLIARIK